MAFRRRHKTKPERQQPERIEAPKKDHVNMSTEDQLVDRLRRMKLPEPPAGVRERSLERYKEWLNSQQGRNRYRDD
jgi:hypothetical protein